MSARRLVSGVGWLVGLAACGFPRPPHLSDDAGGVDSVTDASPAGTPPQPHVVLDWQIASLLASGDPDPTITYAPIDPAPTVRIASLDGAFGVDNTSYSTSDGSIAIPPSYLNTTWRLEYTLADDIPHEVQWDPEETLGHLTVPIFGRVQREAAPVGGGYTITPSNPPASYNTPFVLTTGVWTEGGVPTSVVGATVDFDFYNARSLSGEKGRPNPAFGDHALLVDYGSSADGCRFAVGSAALDSAAIQPMMHTVHTPVWDADRKSITCSPVADAFRFRLSETLGQLSSINTGGQRFFGILVSASIPGLPGLLGLASEATSETRLGFDLPPPIMQTLSQCPYAVDPLPTAVQPSILDNFSHIVHVQLYNFRRVKNSQLTSGMETVLTAAAGAFQVEFPAAIPTRLRLATPSGTVALDGDIDQVAVGPARGTFDFEFTPEMDTNLRADYYEIVLNRFDTNGNLGRERVYIVTAPKVRIEASLLVPDAEYVFEIRSYKGRPAAPRGNFAPVEYPYGSAIVFSRTFKAS